MTILLIFLILCDMLFGVFVCVLWLVSDVICVLDCHFGFLLPDCHFGFIWRLFRDTIIIHLNHASNKTIQLFKICSNIKHNHFQFTITVETSWQFLILIKCLLQCKWQFRSCWKSLCPDDKISFGQCGTNQIRNITPWPE